MHISIWFLVVVWVECWVLRGVCAQVDRRCRRRRRYHRRTSLRQSNGQFMQKVLSDIPIKIKNE